MTQAEYLLYDQKREEIRELRNAIAELALFLASESNQRQQLQMHFDAEIARHRALLIGAISRRSIVEYIEANSTVDTGRLIVVEHLIEFIKNEPNLVAKLYDTVDECSQSAND